jgi:hypothetical protein
MIPKELEDYLKQIGVDPSQVSETDFFEKMKKEFQSEEFQKRIEELDAKAAMDWSILAYQVVGHEHIPKEYYQ